jgi:hypothetical protein
MAITLNTHITIPEDVFFQDLNGESVILEVASGKYFGLDEIGTRIWNLLAEHKALQPAYEILLAEYEVDPARLESDLIAMVQKLVEKELMHLDKSAG